MTYPASIHLQIPLHTPSGYSGTTTRHLNPWSYSSLVGGTLLGRLTSNFWLTTIALVNDLLSSWEPWPHQRWFPSISISRILLASRCWLPSLICWRCSLLQVARTIRATELLKVHHWTPSESLIVPPPSPIPNLSAQKSNVGRKITQTHILLITIIWRHKCHPHLWNRLRKKKGMRKEVFKIDCTVHNF